MLFPTLSFFLFFLTIFPLVIIFKPFVKSYQVVLLAINIVFYSFWNTNFTYLLIGSVIINYLINRLIADPKISNPNLIDSTVRNHQLVDNSSNQALQNSGDANDQLADRLNKKLVIPNTKRRKQFFLGLGILLNILFLAVCKYYTFFVDSGLSLLANFNISLDIIVNRIAVPIGISFYTFRCIAHLVDVYQRKLAQVDFLEFANYITFFPQIASGPIARPAEFYSDLNSPSKYNYSISEVGLAILSGFAKKYVIASYLFTVVNRPFAVPNNYNSLELFVAMLGYACLIFVDFSGYSDMANGISMLLGFRPVPNFNQPYCAVSLSDFWHRWHISLSHWLRDYLYIPLGGSRVVWYRKYFNLFITMFLGGIWHGSGLNFMIWGALHGVGLWFSHYFRWLWSDIQGFPRLLLRLAGTVSTFGFVCLTWIFFNCPNYETAIKYLTQMFSFTTMNDLGELGSGNVISHTTLAVIGLVLACQFIDPKPIQQFRQILDRHIAIATVFMAVGMYICIRLGPETVPPFIYFNF